MLAQALLGLSDEAAMQVNWYAEATFIAST